MPAGNRRGQSTLEYVLVLGVVLLAIIAIANTTIRPGINSVMQTSGNTIREAAERVQEDMGLN